MITTTIYWHILFARLGIIFCVLRINSVQEHYVVGRGVTLFYRDELSQGHIPMAELDWNPGSSILLSMHFPLYHIEQPSGTSIPWLDQEKEFVWFWVYRLISVDYRKDLWRSRKAETVLSCICNCVVTRMKEGTGLPHNALPLFNYCFYSYL